MNAFNFNSISLKSIFKAFNVAFEPIALTDANLKDGVKFIYINPSFLKETGYTKKVTQRCCLNLEKIYCVMKISSDKLLTIKKMQRLILCSGVSRL